MLSLILCKTKGNPQNSSTNVKFRATKPSLKFREGTKGKAFFTWPNKESLGIQLVSFRGDDR